VHWSLFSAIPANELAIFRLYMNATWQGWGFRVARLFSGIFSTNTALKFQKFADKVQHLIIPHRLDISLNAPGYVSGKKKKISPVKKKSFSWINERGHTYRMSSPQ
jgi:hypothetical protein